MWEKRREAAIEPETEAERLIANCRERIDRGERVDPAEVIRANPELARQLREGLATFERLERAFPAPPPAAAEDALAGSALGPYRVMDRLGSGGMGTVYRARVERHVAGRHTGEWVALKVLHPHLLEREGFFKRFLREAELGRQVAHENVVRTLDADALSQEGKQRHFLVMELVEGQTLRALLDELGSVPEELCRHIGREVARALVAIHAAGIVHRDLKPENVLITPEHRIKVMDLGVARLKDEVLRLSQTGAFVGSVLYGAPEQFRGGTEDVDGRADLYALGLTLYELSTGRHPFEHDDLKVAIRKQLTEEPRSPAELNPQLSPFFEEVVKTLLAKDREKRFADAATTEGILEQGEGSIWWKARAVALRAATKRPLRRIRIPRETALYGREVELAKLRALFDKAKAGEGQVVLVEGEAGIGKSRLVDEFVGLLQREGEDLNFLFGSYPPGGAATTSGAFATAFREQFGDGTLDAGLREALPQTPLLVPAFGALLRGDATPTGAEPLTKDSLQTVFVHCTRSLASERTTVLLIEDLHFAPEEGRSLFAALALAVPGHRILLVGATRPGIDEKWTAQVAGHPQATRLALPRLGPKELVHLLRDALKSERLAEELAGLIAVKSDGNPFFVFELLRGLRDGQFLVQRPDGTWHTTQILRDIQVPSSIQDLVQARVADLPDEDRNLLDVASCCGFEFDPLLAGAVLGMERIPLLQRLAKIEKRHRLVRSAGRRFVFDHHQVQEALYGGLPDLLRAEYHAALAEALESREKAAERDPQTLDGALCVDLAEHLFKGAKGERAVRYLDAALDHLEKGYLNDAAVRLADRALAAPGLVLGRARVELLLRKAARLDLLGRRDAERVALDEGRALADADGDAALRAWSRVLLGVNLRRISRNDEAMAGLREAQDLARAAGDRRTEATATGALGSVLLNLGRFAEAQEHFERTLALAREIGDRRGEATAMGNLGCVLLSLGCFAAAQECLERHLAFAREIGDRRGEAMAAGNLACVFASLGRHTGAQVHYERSLSLAREIGDRRTEATATGNLGIVFGNLGRLAEAQKYHARYAAVSRELGGRQEEATALSNLGAALDTLGDGPQAREALESSLALYREIGDRRGEGFALGWLGEVVARAGDQGESRRLIDESLALRRKIGDRSSVSVSLLARGHLRAVAGDSEAARVDFVEAAALASELGLPGVAVLAAAHAAALPGGDLSSAVAVLAENDAHLGVCERLEARFLLWQVTRDHDHLAEAKRLLDLLVAHAPEKYRETMVANVPLHRDIARAAKEAGLA